MSGPRLALNMHPLWLGNGSAADFLFPLRERGLSALEFTLDLSSPGWSAMSALIEESRWLGFGLAFHAPFKGRYGIAGFSGAGRREIERLYRPVIDYARRVAAQAGSASPTPLVVHGAKGDRPRRALRRDSEAFLAWVLDAAPNLYPCLELLVRERDAVGRVGDGKAELAEIVAAMGSDRVGICWDLGHDARNGSQAVPPGFVPLVRHVHVHDISPAGKDHRPLFFGSVPYADHLRALTRAGYAGIVTLEVDGFSVSRLAKARGVHPYRILGHSFDRLTALISGPGF